MCIRDSAVVVADEVDIVADTSFHVVVLRAHKNLDALCWWEKSELDLPPMHLFRLGEIWCRVWCTVGCISWSQTKGDMAANIMLLVPSVIRAFRIWDAWNDVLHSRTNQAKLVEVSCVAKRLCQLEESVSASIVAPRLGGVVTLHQAIIEECSTYEDNLLFDACVAANATIRLHNNAA